MTTILRTAGAGLVLLAGALPAAAKDCRVPEAPPGVRAPLPAGCSPARPARTGEPSALRAGREPGAILLENGTEIRIRGRVRADAIGSR